MSRSINPAQLPLNEQLVHLRTVLSTNKTLLLILERTPSLNLPNWYLAAGAVSQTIWNHMSNLPPETGISDYDLVYHDASDLSWEAEDRVIQAGKELFADLPTEVEIRNQARVHLWYTEKYGVYCPAHESVEAGIDSWISTSAMIGVRVDKAGGGDWSIYAPRGLSDFFNLVARPNDAVGKREQYENKVERWKGVWKGLTVEPWPVQKV